MKTKIRIAHHYQQSMLDPMTACGAEGAVLVCESRNVTCKRCLAVLRKKGFVLR